MKPLASKLVVPLIAVLAGCRDSSIPPTLPQQPRILFNRHESVSTGTEAWDARYVCSTALRTSDATIPWRYGRVSVRFARPELASDNRAITYQYRGYDDHGTLIAVATCRIPGTDRAILRMNRILRVPRAENRSGLVTTNSVGLERLVVTACAPGYTGEYPYCLPNPTAVEIPADGSGSGFWTGGGGGDYTPPPDESQPDASQDTVPAGKIPDCTQPQDDSWAQAYCRATSPTGLRLERTNAALEQIAGRGPECANIAQAGSDLLNAGRLRYFDPLPGDFGGWGDPGIGAIISSTEVDQFGDPTRPEAFQAFQRILIHEIEHTMGRSHIDAAGLNTPNSQFCSGH